MLREIVEAVVHKVVENSEVSKTHCADETPHSVGALNGAPLNENRSTTDRRKGERRQFDLGPANGQPERRFYPDLRGVVFPLHYSRPRGSGWGIFQKSPWNVVISPT